MGFYDLSKAERVALVQEIHADVGAGLEANEIEAILQYTGDGDVHVRKHAARALGETYLAGTDSEAAVLACIDSLLGHADEKVRQAAVYALAEIGKHAAAVVTDRLERAMADPHPKVRNAVITALKQMGQKNPRPTLAFARTFLHHPDPETRRQVVHGIELRGRTHPADVLPLLREIQDESHPRVRPMIVHVASQCSYKEGCLPVVLDHLEMWENTALVHEILDEIVAVHGRYADFSAHAPAAAAERVATLRERLAE